jgi:hypothetical protein
MAMATSSSFGFDNLSALSRYTLLGFLLLMATACHRAANLIPYGYEGVFDDDARASQAARVDYPIVVTDPTKYNTFRVTEKGERNWFWHRKFWNDQQSWWDRTTTWYRIFVSMDNMEQPICITDWIRYATTVQEIPCPFAPDGYLAKPLLVTLLYKMGGDEQRPPADDDITVGAIPRFYYLIQR